MSSIDALRDRIAGIDDRLVELIAERLDVAAEIGRLKKAAGLPLRAWGVERTVLERAERRAQSVGAPEELIRGVMRELISASRAQQERGSYSQYSGPAATIAIVGGRGRMGRWFAEFFGSQGHTVRIVDAAPPAPGEPPPRTLEDAIGGADFALLATPMEATPALIDALAARRFAGIAFDVASLKGPLTAAIEAGRARGLRYASVHPLFGPATRMLSNRVICICDCGDAEAAARVRALFEDTAATLAPLSFEAHDRIMAQVLGLSHVINIIFTRTLMAAGVSFAELTAIGSTTFHSQMRTTATVMNEDPSLYYAIQRLNPFTPQVYAALSAAVEETTAAVMEARAADFERIMRDGRDWMGDGHVD